MKNQNGITLIAIIITVIVMIILAGTAVIMSTGNSGVLSNSHKASEKNTLSESKEYILETWAYVLARVDNNQMSYEKYVEGTSDISENEQNKLAANLFRSYIKGYGTGYLVPDKNNNYVYEVRLNGETDFKKAYKVKFNLKGKNEAEEKTFYIVNDTKVYYDSSDEYDEIAQVK